MRFIPSYFCYLIIILFLHSGCAYVNGDYHVKVVLQKSNQQAFTVAESQMTLDILADRLRVYGISKRNFNFNTEDHQITAHVRYVDQPERIKMLLSMQGRLGFSELYYNSAQLQERFQEANETLQNMDVGLTPLLELFSPSKNENDPIIGFIELANMKKLLAAFRAPTIKKIFPQDFNFALSAKPLAGKKKQLYRLYAIKSSSRLLLDNRMISNAYPSLDDSGRDAVLVEMTPEATHQWAALTQKYLQRHLAIIIDGRVYAAPLVHKQILNGQARITGNFDKYTAQDLADILELGTLPRALKIVSENVVKRTD